MLVYISRTTLVEQRQVTLEPYHMPYTLDTGRLGKWDTDSVNNSYLVMKFWLADIIADTSLGRNVKFFFSPQVLCSGFPNV